MANVFRVLHVDDDPIHTTHTREALLLAGAEKFQVEHADDLTDAISQLEGADYDVVLLDLGLPDSEGLDTLARVRESTNERIPIVVLTGQRDEDTAVDALHDGAQDYIVKDQVTPRGLVRAIQFAIQRHQLLDQLSAANVLLREKNQKLAQLYETAQQFVDNVSHEFRTPLTVIKEFVSLIKDGLMGPLNEEQQKYLGTVLYRTDDLAFMVDDMLDVSRLESGLLSPWRREHDVKEIIADVCGQLDTRAASKGIRLKFEVPDGLASVYCDEEKARRTLINLLTNALKFTPSEGTVQVTASAYGDNDVRISVADDGPGISTEDLAAIFERFKQLDSGIRATSKGFGLGLNIARELARLNLGELDVASHEGQGSEFSFTLPVAKLATLVDRYLELVESPRLSEDTVTVLTVEVLEPVANAVPVVDEFLQYWMRGNDFIYRESDSRWLLLTSCPTLEFNELMERLDKEWAEYRRNFPHGQLPDFKVTEHLTWEAGTPRAELLNAIGGYGNVDCDDAKTSVLVIDDEVEVTEALKRRLEEAGYNVLTAIDGQSGCDLAADKTPDAIILDICMSQMDGLTALQKLKSTEPTRQTPIIMLSSVIRDQSRALEQGAAFFVPKPYDPTTLIAAIETSLEGAADV